MSSAKLSRSLVALEMCTLFASILFPLVIVRCHTVGELGPQCPLFPCPGPDASKGNHCKHIVRGSSILSKSI